MTKQLAGKKGVYEVEVVEVKEKVLPAIDDAFAKKYDAENLPKLREGVQRDLENELKYSQAKVVRGQIIRALLTATNFDLPETAVAHETRTVVYDIVRENTQRGVARDLIEKQKDEIYSAAAQSAKERVKLSFLIQRIAEKEGIQVSQDEVLKRVQSLAMAYQIPLEKFLKDLQKRNGVSGALRPDRARKSARVPRTKRQNRGSSRGGGESRLSDDLAATLAAVRGLWDRRGRELTGWLPSVAQERLKFDEFRQKPQNCSTMKNFSVLLVFILAAFSAVAQTDTNIIVVPADTHAPASQPGTNGIAVQTDMNPVAAQTGTNVATVPIETNAPAPPSGTNAAAAPAGMNAATREMSLEDCIQEALQHNLDVQIERTVPRISLYNLRAAYGGYDPLLNVSGQHNYDVSGSTFQNGFATSRFHLRREQFQI